MLILKLAAPLALLIQCSHVTATVIPPPGAIAYWSFDRADLDGNRITDGSGNGSDGQIHKAVLVGGRLSEALELDGTDGGITFDGLNIKGKYASICLWVKRNSSGLRRLVFIYGLFQVGFSGDELFVHTGRIGRADTNLPLADLGIAGKKWNHLSVTWDTAADADNVKVYVNGQLRAKATLDVAKGRDLKIETLRIGHTGNADSANQSFDGIIDEVALYDITLPADLIDQYHTKVLASVGESPPTQLNQLIITQGSAEPEPPYIPRVTYTGPKKLIRIGSELCSRMLGVNSMAEADLPTKVKLWQETGLDGLVFSMTSHDRTAEKY